MQDNGGMRSSVRPSTPWSCAIALASAVGCASAPAVRAPASTEAVLRAQTQEMLDAIAAGDAAVWDRYVDPRILYVSEAGEVEGKAQLLAELKPLPAGVSGKIAIGRFEVRQHGDTALVLHVDEEDEDYFGHPIHARYLTTATWRLGPGGWKLIASQVLATLIDPPAIALPAAQLDEYTGTYQLTDAIRYAIRRDGDHLIGERTGRPAQPLRVEARDVLFVPGQPRSRKIFQRDASGRITGFADRREARDVVWVRLP
jgi:ketosteroid isomerase-like protein